MIYSVNFDSINGDWNIKISVKVEAENISEAIEMAKREVNCNLLGLVNNINVRGATPLKQKKLKGFR